MVHSSGFHKSIQWWFEIHNHKSFLFPFVTFPCTTTQERKSVSRFARVTRTSRKCYVCLFYACKTIKTNREGVCWSWTVSFVWFYFQQKKTEHWIKQITKSKYHTAKFLFFRIFSVSILIRKSRCLFSFLADRVRA